MSTILIIIVLLVLFGGGVGFYGRNQGWYGNGGFGGIIGLVLVIALILYLLGGRL